jgi:hypothetical protein
MSKTKLMPVTPLGGKTMLREDRAYMGLTAKQWAYAEARARGGSVSESYIAAYEPPETMGKHALWSTATQIEASQKVQARIRARLLELQGDNSALPVIGRDFVITGIASLAIAGEKESTRLKGYELLGKALGLFDRGPEQIEKPKTVNDVDAKLRELLRATMVNPGPVIDAEILPDSPIGEDQEPTDE